MNSHVIRSASGRLRSPRISEGPTKVLGWFIGELPRDEPDTWRRRQFLVVASFVMAAVGLLFSVETYILESGVHHVSAGLLAGAVLCLSNPFLLKWTGNAVWPGTLLVAEVFAALGMVAYTDGGTTASALWWLTMLPLLAAFLVGPRLGWAAAGMVILQVVFFFHLEREGYSFPSQFANADDRLLNVLALCALTLTVALLGWMYESQTIQSLLRINQRLRWAHDALRQAHMDLQQAHGELERRVEERTAALASANDALRSHIEERNRMEFVLRQSEERFRTLVQHASDIITILHPAGTIIYESPSLLPTLGYAPEELIGLNALDFVHPDDQVMARQVLARLLEHPGELIVAQCRFRHADGHWVPIEMTANNLIGTPMVDGILVNSRDITERRVYEDRLRSAKEQAEEMARLKSSFLANMSHEIRTPLTGIIGFAEVLEDELADEYQTFARSIGTSGKRLLDTLNSILDLSRIDARLMQARPRPVDLVAEAGEAVSVLHPLAEKKHLALRFESPQPALFATHDPAWIGRIINNLVGNAIKFTKEGGISVVLCGEPDRVVLQVHDTGIGISEEFLPYLFDEFKQESTGLARSHEGSGLGLAITARLIGAMGGKIRVESAKGAGSTFTVVLPLRHGEPVCEPSACAAA